mgnify:CR=1 FL=1
MLWLVWIAGGYLIGAIPCGVLVARAMGGRDPRTAGSGNIGATNVGRTLGKKAGILTLLGDILKGALPAFAAARVTGDPWLASAAGFAAFSGHLFPVYLGFRGGKGVATGAGVFLALCPWALLAAGAVFALFLWRWRMVSLGSVGAALSLPLWTSLLAADATAAAPVVSLALAVSALTVWKHRENIRRIRAGTESKFGQRA